jgi:dienelactone hydrolase
MKTMVRALYRVTAIPGAQPPYDRVSLKVYYPAVYGDTEAERNSGLIPANPDFAPCPVVILLPGINLSPESASWLSLRLAQAGYVTVAVSTISEEMPGYISISPGLDLDRLKPDGYGSGPSCSLLQPVMDELGRLQADSVLTGTLDLNRVVLGGHSAGGTAALLNANPDWFPGIRAAFCYGAHSGASMALGWPAETVLPLPASVPVLLLGGDQDGVIAASAHRYGRQEADPLYTVTRTFDEAVPACDQSSYLMILRGANHFTFAQPHDGCSGREFLDWPASEDTGALQALLGDLVLDFLDSAVRGDRAAGERMELRMDAPELVLSRRK